MIKKISFTLLILYFLTTIGYSQTLQIYGGENHDEYLGYLNCNNYDTKSIWNGYSEFGSKYNSKSIWNSYSDYGGEYSDISPFNKNASNPPVLVDSKGKFYGYFTANKYKDKRTNVELAIFITDYWKTISENPDEYYSKLFK